MHRSFASFGWRLTSLRMTPPKKHGPRRSIANGQGADWERCSAFDGGRRGEEAERFVLQLVEVAEVLDNRDAVGQEQGVRGACRVFHIVDVGAINADEGGAGVHQMFAGRRGEVRPGAEVISAPAPRPVGVDEDGFAAHGEPETMAGSMGPSSGAGIRMPGRSASFSSGTEARSCPCG